MLARKYVLFSLLLPCFIIASDGSGTGVFDSLDEHEITAPLGSSFGVQEDGASLAVTVVDEEEEDVETEVPHIEDLPEEVQSEVKQALQNVGISIAAATALLNNSFGRIALMCFLGYKSFKNFKRAFSQKIDRNVHISKGVSYLIAAGMLSQDGYAWLLNQ